MPLTLCDECSGTVSTTATACPHCGARTGPPMMASKPAVVIARTVLALLSVALFFLSAGAYLVAVIPAVILVASFLRPVIATYGLATLFALFVLASLLDPGPS